MVTKRDARRRDRPSDFLLDALALIDAARVKVLSRAGLPRDVGARAIEVARRKGERAARWARIIERVGVSEYARGVDTPEGGVDSGPAHVSTDDSVPVESDETSTDTTQRGVPMDNREATFAR